MRLFVLWVALLSLSLQPPDRIWSSVEAIPIQLPDGPEANLPDNEKQIPPGHYCMNHAERKMAKNAHECHCQYHCTVTYDSQGVPQYQEQETPECKAYCKKNGRTCTCHPEAPCPSPA